MLWVFAVVFAVAVDHFWLVFWNIFFMTFHILGMDSRQNHNAHHFRRLNDVEPMMSDCFIASGSPFPLFILITITIYNYYPVIIMIITHTYHDCPMIS